MRTHATEFPDCAVPPEITALAVAGKIQDQSWHNDICPSFALTADGSAVLWVDYRNPARREFPEGKRYSVGLYSESGDYLGSGIDTDSLPELLAYLADHWDIR